MTALLAIQAGTVDDFLAGNFQWTAGAPVLAIDTNNLPPSTGAPWSMAKDPSPVCFQGRWHLFCTVKRTGSGSGRIRIGYMSFLDWPDAQAAPWHLIDLYEPGAFVDYHGAPQVFYFTPHGKWYMVYQLADNTRGIPYGPCYSTTRDITDPTSWTLPTPLYPPMPDKAGLDHWVICDAAKAYHFFTTLNGQMWRAETRLSDFPSRWTQPVLALQADFWEASHTYKVRSLNKYLTVVVALGSGSVGRRYYQAYLADSLGGAWQPLAATKPKSFASLLNVQQTAGQWAVGIDHGELLRTGYDEKLEIDPTALRFLFQSEGPSGGEHKLGLLIATDTQPPALPQGLDVSGP
ncbi:MAG: hypothetical protein JXR37_16095 [Kiritimatiellae bacterium]|nr:hypothetical protein [Kiritimatiellia bacterium]